jgi:hypothetical protein
MAEEKTKKPSWHFPGAGRGTWSGFFVAWLFVAGVIGITVVSMLVGKGPMPLRVVGYDLGLENADPAKVDLTKLTSAIKQTSFMVLVIRGTSEKLTEELSRKLEVKKENVISEGSAAILSKYPIERSEKTLIPVIRFGESGRFGVVNVDLRTRTVGDGQSELERAAGIARKEFGKAPHAIFALCRGVTTLLPAGYVEVAGEEEEATDWRIFIPGSVVENFKECYVPTDNKAIKDFSDRSPVIVRFVFRERDFQ